MNTDGCESLWLRIAHLEREQRVIADLRVESGLVPSLEHVLDSMLQVKFFQKLSHFQLMLNFVFLTDSFYIETTKRGETTD